MSSSDDMLLFLTIVAIIGAIVGAIVGTAQACTLELCAINDGKLECSPLWQGIYGVVGAFVGAVVSVCVVLFVASAGNQRF
jgi:hypothetical protein